MEVWNIQVRQEKHLNQRLKRGYALFCWHVTRPTSEQWHLPVDFSFVILVLKRCKIWKRPRNQVGLKWLEKSTPKSLSTHDLKVPWGSSAWLIIYFYSLWLTHPGSISYFCGNVSLQDDHFNVQFKCPLIFNSKQLGHQHLLIFGDSWKVIVYSKSTRAPPIFETSDAFLPAHASLHYSVICWGDTWMLELALCILYITGVVEVVITFRRMLL